MDIKTAAKKAKNASIRLAAVSGEEKNKALYSIVSSLSRHEDEIQDANQKDMKQSVKDGLAPPLLKRLLFNKEKIRQTIDGIESLISLPDPVGFTLSATQLDQGLELYKVSCPIGVIGVVFESRPDALVQISTLCLKSGNAVLLKGGKEASRTNRILSEIITRATLNSSIPEGWLGLCETRSDVADMLRLDAYIDLFIPRGSNTFVQHIMENTKIPVLGHADGICHVYIDRHSDLDMGVKISVDSKCQYVAVCNAVETILVHRDIAKIFLPEIKKALEVRGVEIRGCDNVRKIIEAIPANETDWHTEYLDLIVSIKIVGSLDEAIVHINNYGSGHTDVIVTKDKKRGFKFMDYVDSADVFMNCSSRFSDGFRFGLGAEVGISTNKIHARGPVGLEGLMIYKYRLVGDGHVVDDYVGENAKSLKHNPLKKTF